VRLIRGIQNTDPYNTELYRLYISQLQDSSTLGVVEAFTEEAPQVRVCRDQRYHRGARLSIHKYLGFLSATVFREYRKSSLNNLIPNLAF